MGGNKPRLRLHSPAAIAILLLLIAASSPFQAAASNPGSNTGSPLLLPITLYYAKNVSYSLSAPVSPSKAVVVASTSGNGSNGTEIILYNMSSGKPLDSIDYNGRFKRQKDLIFEAGMGWLPKSYGTAYWNPETHSFSAFYYNGTSKVWIAYYNPLTGRIASEPRDLDSGYKPLGIVALQGSASALLAWNKQENRLYVSVGAGMLEILRHYYSGSPVLLTAIGNTASLLYFNSQDQLAAAWFNSSPQPLGSTQFNVSFYDNYRIGVGPDGWIAVVKGDDSGIVVELASPEKHYIISLPGYKMPTLITSYGPVWSNNTLVTAFTVEDPQGNVVLVTVNASTGAVNTVRVPVDKPWNLLGLYMAGDYPVLLLRSGMLYYNVTVYTPNLSRLVGSVSPVKEVAVWNNTLYVISEPQGPNNPVFSIYRITSMGGTPSLQEEWEIVLPIWNAGYSHTVLAPLNNGGTPIIVASFRDYISGTLYRLTVTVMKPVRPIPIPTCSGEEVLLYPTGGPWHITNETVKGDNVELKLEVTAWKGAITIKEKNSNITVYGILALTNISTVPLSPGVQGRVKVKLAVNLSAYASIPGKPALRQVCFTEDVKPDTGNTATWIRGILRYIIPLPTSGSTQLILVVQALEPLTLKPGAAPVNISIEKVELNTHTTTTSTANTTIIMVTSTAAGNGTTGSTGASNVNAGFASANMQSPRSAVSGGSGFAVKAAALGVVLLVLLVAALLLKR